MAVLSAWGPRASLGTHARTRIERDFDAAAVRRMKAAARRDLTVGGPHLAASAFEAGLVDECHPLPHHHARAAG